MKEPFFNIFINGHFETEDLRFRCVFDSDKVKIPEDIDIFTHVVEEKNRVVVPSSIFFSDKGDDQLKDISLLLTIAQGTHIFSKGQNLGRVLNQRKDDFSLFLTDEIESFLNQSFKNLSSMEKERLEVIKTALLMFYEAKYLLVYDGLRNILMMNCFEFLIGAIYRQDKNYSENDLKLRDSYKHIIEKFNYQKYIDNKLEEKIKPKKLPEFKKEKDISSIASFIDQFQKMRNWIAHGKQHKKPELENSPSNSEFTFSYRLENFMRIILVDLIYRKDYVRKFDVLYQLILEKNVRLIISPEFSKLKFYDTRKYTLIDKKDES